MTHAELYEIVKDHRDVWGEHFHTVRRGDESTEFVRHYTNDAGEPEHVEMELLGLGVAWLVRTDGQFNAYGPVSPGDTFDVPSTTGAWGEGTSILAAVYAAIAEVRAKA